MGLLDDASNLLGQQAELAAAVQAAREKEYVPWSPDWAIELASLLTERAVPTQPVYVQGALTKPVMKGYENVESTSGFASTMRSVPVWSRTWNSTYWDDAWALQGWRPNSEWGPQGVQVLMATSGSLWTHPGGGEFHSLFLKDGEWVETPRGASHLINFPEVHPEHRSKFLLVSFRPKTASHNSATLRAEVGVSVAAALSDDRVTQNTGWIVGVKP